MKLYQAIHRAIVARNNCERSNNTEWLNKWTERLEDYQDFLPSGSGIDNGCKLDFDDLKRIVIQCDYHHMNDGGYYDGWTEHKAIVTPSFDGIDIKITGRDRNQIKDYLAEIISYALEQNVDNS